MFHTSLSTFILAAVVVSAIFMLYFEDEFSDPKPSALGVKLSSFLLPKRNAKNIEMDKKYDEKTMMTLNRSSEVILSRSLNSGKLVATVIDPIIISAVGDTRSYSSQYRRLTRDIEVFVHPAKSNRVFDDWHEGSLKTFSDPIVIHAISSDHTTLAFITRGIGMERPFILYLEYFGTRVDFEVISRAKIAIDGNTKITALSIDNSIVIYSLEYDKFSFRCLFISKFFEFSPCPHGPLVSVSTNNATSSILNSKTISLSLLTQSAGSDSTIIIAEHLSNRRQYSYLSQILKISQSNWGLIEIVTKRGYTYKHSYEEEKGLIHKPIIGHGISGNCATLAVRPYVTAIDSLRSNSSIEILNLDSLGFFTKAMMSPNCDVVAIADSNNEILLLQRNLSPNILDSKKTNWNIANELKVPNFLKSLQILDTIIVHFEVEEEQPAVSPRSFSFSGFSFVMLPFGVFFYSSPSTTKNSQTKFEKKVRTFCISIYEGGRIHSIDITAPHLIRLPYVVSPGSSNSSNSTKEKPRSESAIERWLSILEEENDSFWDFVIAFLLISGFVLWSLYRSMRDRTRLFQNHMGFNIGGNFPQNINAGIPPSN